MDWPFVPGLKLSEALYRDGVAAVVGRHAPGLRYAVGRLDTGSDVLGFDTPMSMDHGWGPRATLFLSEPDWKQHADDVSRLLAEHLPTEVLGVPTNFASPKLIDDGLKQVSTGPVQHGVAITTADRFFRGYIGFDAEDDIALLDWLTVPSQRLRTIAAGRVFHDPDGEIERRRRKLEWYPRGVWLYLMASQWRRIGQEEAFMSRAAGVGDDLGSRLIAGRLAMEIIRLAFLQERQHIPYSKWVGSAFRQLPGAERLSAPLEAVMRARDGRTRERQLNRACRQVAARHNRLKLTAHLVPAVRPFHGRPFQVIDADRFAEALEAEIDEPSVRALPKGIGAVWQFADSTDVLDEIEHCRRLARVYARRP